MSEDTELLLDYILQFLESPLYTSPINNFIDKVRNYDLFRAHIPPNILLCSIILQNCDKFEDNEENKLEYTLIHNEYIALVEKVLENGISSLGISNQQVRE
jgi:hypothetical protein